MDHTKPDQGRLGSQAVVDQSLIKIIPGVTDFLKSEYRPLLFFLNILFIAVFLACSDLFVC